MPKRTPMDLLNDYLKRGMKPPQALERLVAEQEAVRKPSLALDPPQMLAMGMSGGMAGILPRLIQNELVQGGFDLSDAAVPKLAKNLKQLAAKAQKGVSGQTKPLSGTMGETGELLPKGVKLPGGATAAPGTKALKSNWNKNTSELADEDFPNQFPTQPTQKLTPSDIGEILSQHLVEGGDAVGLKAFHDNLVHGKTGPLPPQGAVTEKFGQFMKGGPIGKASNLKGAFEGGVGMGQFQNLPQQPKTEKLTPFEAHENVTPDHIGAPGQTGSLLGNLATQQAYQESENNPSERTMSLEPEDIEEMAGGDRPSTGDLLEQFKKNLGPKDTLPLPENTLYHGLKVFGHTPARKSLSGMAQEGMKGGWFSEEPHQPFGPHFVATTPEDLPPMLIRDKQFSVDPDKEIIPRWKGSTENLETKMKLQGRNPETTLVPDTIKGRLAKRSLWPNVHQLMGADEMGGGEPYRGPGGATVPPEKLFMANKTGDIIGRLAPKGGKGGGLQDILNRAGAFKNVLEKGTSTVGNVFARLFGSDPELTGYTDAEKVAKLKQFLGSKPKDSTLQSVWAPLAKQVKTALEEAGEDVPK